MTDRQVPRGKSGSDEQTETPGDRLRLIRLALGDGKWRAEPIAGFISRVRRLTGAQYHASTISMLERMEQRWRLDDVAAFAAVDPLKRGEAWLAYGSAASGPVSARPDDVEVPEPKAPARSKRRGA